MANSTRRDNFSDVIFQGIRVYIEGVQVPFNSIQVTSGVGVLPTATISIPVQAGLMDIARFYSPKVHIFFEDVLHTYSSTTDSNGNVSSGEKNQLKLLFSGLIAQVAYGKSKNSGTSYISLNCIHKYHLINECLISYTGWLDADPTNANEGGTTKVDKANSMSSVLEALQGLTRPNSQDTPNKDRVVSEQNPEGSVDVVPTEFESTATRLVGMPGIMVNFWNQMKRAAYNKALTKNNLYENEAFVKLYKPLIEEGLKFFQRLTGHLPIEYAIDSTRQPSCEDDIQKNKDILIPPCNQNFMRTSATADLAIRTMKNSLSSSGEITTLYQIFDNFFSSIDYDIITLTSPSKVVIPPALDAETADISNITETEDILGVYDLSGAVDMTKASAVDTVVKPRLPFYFSPTCNVLFPSMYHSINVSYDEINIPTRIDARNLEGPDDRGMNNHFRAPASIRKAIAKKISGADSNVPFNLLSSTGSSGGAIGLYEQGRGVKVERIDLPRWLGIYSRSALGSNTGSTEKLPDANEDPYQYAALQSLNKGWLARYPSSLEENMNPYSRIIPGISSHHRLLFSSADYYFTQSFARSKAGTVNCIFNPFIVPGYPMDILEKNPLFPSFHAMCTSVTHTITAESCETSVQFTAAMTYAELGNYYIPFVSPFLQVTLGLAENPTLLNPDKKAYNTADTFYRYVLGVPSIAPTDLMDFSTGELYSHKWNDSGSDWMLGSKFSLPSVSGGELNPMLTSQGNLSLTYRPIETMEDIENPDYKYTGTGNKFIHMTPKNYNSTAIKYEDATLLDASTRFEIGESQFLDYTTYFGETLPPTEEGAGNAESSTTTTADGSTYDSSTDNVTVTE